jgi:hypothetical protein
MRLGVQILVTVLLTLAAFANPTSATPCREKCYAWCADNGRNSPGSQCRNECAAQPRCGIVTGKRLVGSSCYAWCRANKPGSAECKADCASRR